MIPLRLFLETIWLAETFYVTFYSRFVWFTSSSSQASSWSHQYILWVLQMRYIAVNQRASLSGQWGTNQSSCFPAGARLRGWQAIQAGDQCTWLISYKNHFLSPVSQCCFWLLVVLCFLWSEMLRSFLGCTSLLGVCVCEGKHVPHAHSLHGHYALLLFITVVEAMKIFFICPVSLTVCLGV